MNEEITMLASVGAISTTEEIRGEYIKMVDGILHAPIARRFLSRDHRRMLSTARSLMQQMGAVELQVWLEAFNKEP